MAAKLSRGQAVVLVAICALLAAGYTDIAYRAFRARHLAALGDEVSLAHAALLDPANADYPYQIGGLKLLVQQDLPGAEAALRRAVALNPHNARYWLRLASVELVQGNVAGEKIALERAVSADPTTPAVAWEAANFSLADGEAQRALPLLRRVLEARPWESERIFDLCLRAATLDQVLRRLLPETPAAYLSLLHYAVDKHDEAAAAQVWQAAQRLPAPPPANGAMFYLDYLLARGDNAQARSAWDWLVAKDPALRPYVTSGNLVVNGRFSEPFLDAGFDWRFAPSNRVKIEMDNTESHRGAHSLAIHFTGEPAPDAGIYQLVPVRPNTEYQLTAWIKTQEIYAANAPRFQVDDARTGAPLLSSVELVGTRSWEDVGGRFRTGSASDLVRIHLVQPSASHITGVIWIDEVAITSR